MYLYQLYSRVLKCNVEVCGMHVQVRVSNVVNAYCDCDVGYVL